MKFEIQNNLFINFLRISVNVSSHLEYPILYSNAILCIYQKNDIRDGMTDIISVCREISYPSLVRIKSIYTYLLNFKFNLQPKTRLQIILKLMQLTFLWDYFVVKPTVWKMKLISIRNSIALYFLGNFSLGDNIANYISKSWRGKRIYSQKLNTFTIPHFTENQSFLQY